MSGSREARRPAIVLSQSRRAAYLSGMKPIRATAMLLILTAACGSSEPAPAPTAQPVADVQQLMNTILEPAAETYWDAVGWILDLKGTTELRPRTPEEWDAVRNAAYVVAESGNLLMMEGRALDRGQWLTLSQGLVDVGKRAIAAAEARDPQAVFTVGGDVYEACTACHARYATQTLRPSHSTQ